jgi:hypothetical protein
MERDGWILMQSVSRKKAAVWIADKRDAIDDPEFCALYLECDAAFDWSPNDPRLDALVDRAQRWVAKWYGRFEGGQRPVQDPAIAGLLTTPSEPTTSATQWDTTYTAHRDPANSLYERRARPCRDSAEPSGGLESPTASVVNGQVTVPPVAR